MKALYHWIGSHVHAWYGSLIFGFLVFIEGFFVVPVSTLLAVFCLENRSKAYMYAAIATVVSALGALTGYFIGTLLWKAGGSAFLYYVVDEHKFFQLVEQFTTYQAWTTFFVALSPMPFKMLTFSAGFMGLPLIPFLFFSMIARGCRFFAIATLIFLLGDQAQFYVDKYFYWIITVGTLSFLMMWYFMH